MAESPTTKARREQLRDNIRNQLDPPSGERVSSLDGMPISAEDEAVLNEAFALTFRGRRGQSVIDYLARLTVDRIAGPGVEPNALLHMEGSRYIYGVIKARVEIGRKK
jgi:hypothetical protein